MRLIDLKFNLVLSELFENAKVLRRQVGLQLLLVENSSEISELVY